MNTTKLFVLLAVISLGLLQGVLISCPGADESGESGKASACCHQEKTLCLSSEDASEDVKEVKNEQEETEKENNPEMDFKAFMAFAEKIKAGDVDDSDDSTDDGDDDSDDQDGQVPHVNDTITV